MADSPITRARVAVDLLGGDGAPESVSAGVVAALRSDAALSVSLVGPADLCREYLAGAHDVDGRLTLVPADQAVAMDEDPVRAVRAKPDATVCVTAGLVRDDRADAMVSIGPTGAVMAAAVFILNRLPGLARTALAVTLSAASGELVLLDVGANADASPDMLAEHALAGAAYAEVRLGIPRPSVGLLTIGTEAGKGDRLRRAAAALLAGLPVRFVGNVEGYDVSLGGAADVVVTDGFTGNVLLKGMEGTYALLAGLMADCLRGPQAPARELVQDAIGHLHPDRMAGALLLGVDGVVVVGHGSSSPDAVASCISQAAEAVRRGMLPRLREALARLLASRGPALAPVAP